MDTYSLSPTTTVTMDTILGNIETPAEDYGRFRVIQFDPTAQEFQVVDPLTGTVMVSYSDLDVARNFARRLPDELDLDRIDANRRNGGFTEQDKADIRAFDKRMRHDAYVRREYHGTPLVRATEYRAD